MGLLSRILENNREAVYRWLGARYGMWGGIGIVVLEHLRRNPLAARARWPITLLCFVTDQGPFVYTAINPQDPIPEGQLRAVDQAWEKVCAEHVLPVIDEALEGPLPDIPPAAGGCEYIAPARPLGKTDA